MTAAGDTAKATSTPEPEAVAADPAAGSARPWFATRDVTEPIQRADGVTTAERYLQRLCERSFLRLWSYPGIYRDQGVASGRGGKEVCDLLVVFENHVIVFSDKDCDYPDTGDAQRDWSRWYRRAVWKGAQSTWGAERWIREHPERLFLDRACSKPFPIALPEPANAVFHRVVVAHGASVRCRKHFRGGSGSLMLCPSIVGDMHEMQGDRKAMPFVVGTLDASRGYVHVLDDTTVDILLNELTTITDFVSYLEKKETFLRSGRLGMAAGEEELLAFYQKNLNAEGDHDFVVPANATHVMVQDGLWEEFLKSPERRARQKADRISEMWDFLLDRFVEHLIGGTQYFGTGALKDQEEVFRFMARESRTRRRMLSIALQEILEKTQRDRHGARLVAPSHPGDPHYVFLLVPHADDMTDEAYRELRGKALYAYCMATKVVVPEATDIVGLATESGLELKRRSEDMMYLDASKWTSELQKEAEALRENAGIFKTMKKFASSFNEYPTNKHDWGPISMKGADRNSRCPCGSGKKLKKCHGAVA